MPNKIDEKQLRAPAAASGAVTTLGIRCLGARQVVFHVTATDALTITSSVEQVSMDGLTWQTSSAAMAMADSTGTISGVALNAGGRIRLLAPATGVQLIPWKYARIIITPATAIAGLGVTGYSMYDETGTASSD